VHTAFRRAYRRNGADMTHAEFDLNNLLSTVLASDYPLDRAYFRVVLTDDKGNRALTRGYFFDELE
jgi:hypothetical protein